MEPCLPQAWSGYEAEWALTSGRLHLKIERTGTRGLLLDGKPCGDGIPLNQLRGEHQVLFFVLRVSKREKYSIMISYSPDDSWRGNRHFDKKGRPYMTHVTHRN